MTPSSASINFLERLPELRKPVYVLDRLFLIKGYDSGTATWKRCIEQGVSEGLGASTLQGPSSWEPPRHVFNNPEIVRTPSFWVFMEALLLHD